MLSLIKVRANADTCLYGDDNFDKRSNDDSDATDVSYVTACEEFDVQTASEQNVDCRVDGLSLGVIYTRLI